MNGEYYANCRCATNINIKTMKTITAPNGKKYEVDEGWREMSELQGDIRINVLHPDGSCEPESGYTMRTGTYSGTPIAWRPIVPPKEVRWRASEYGRYFYINGAGCVSFDTDGRCDVDNLRHSIGNYFRTREEAEASNKAKVMRDPESERCQ